jgi:acid stress-induced BolA-like protein IbaG/YrbA
MITPDELKAKIEKMAPETQVYVMDLTGTLDHYQAVVISKAFEGKPMIAQHRLVMATVQKEVDSGEVHALTIKTFTPEQYAKYGE